MSNEMILTLRLLVLTVGGIVLLIEKRPVFGIAVLCAVWLP